MKVLTLQTAELLDILLDEDISLVNALVKRLVFAWDPDFTKVTPQEREALEQTDTEIEKGDYVSEDDFWK